MSAEIRVVEARPLFTVKTLARYLACSERQVRILLGGSTPRIESFKVGQQLRIRPEVVEEYLRLCEEAA